MNRNEAMHRLLEAWRERESKRLGYVLSHVEMAHILSEGASTALSPVSLLHQLHRTRPVRDMVLILMRKASPDLATLVDSILTDDEQYAEEWSRQIDAVFPCAS